MPRFTITELNGLTRTIYRDGKPVGDWPAVGFQYVIHGQFSGLAGTHAAALAYVAKELKGTPVPPAIAAESKAVLAADHLALMTAHPFTEQEKADLRALTGLRAFPESFIDPVAFAALEAI